MGDEDYILPVLDGLDEMDPLDAEPDRARVALDRRNEAPWHNGLWWCAAPMCTPDSGNCVATPGSKMSR